jgi:hypothetical protein
VKISRVIITVIAELAMQGIVSDRNARCQVKVLEKITDRPSTTNIVVDLDNKTTANISGQGVEDGQKTLGDFYWIAVLATVNVERRAIVLGQADKVKKVSVLSQIVNAIANSGGVKASKRNVFRGVGRDANASTFNGNSDLVESTANVGPVGQVLQPQVDDGVRDDRYERRRESVASNTAIRAVLNNGVGNNKIV